VSFLSKKGLQAGQTEEGGGGGVSECPFAEGWKNKEGWLIFNDRLVCLDWDEYCTQCRVDDSEDYVFDIDLKEGKR